MRHCYSGLLLILGTILLLELYSASIVTADSSKETDESFITPVTSLEQLLQEKQEQLAKLEKDFEDFKKTAEKEKLDLLKQNENSEMEINRKQAELQKKTEEAATSQTELANVQQQLYELQEIVKNPKISHWLLNKAESLKAYIDPDILEAVKNTQSQLYSSLHNSSYLSTDVVEHLRDTLESGLENTPIRTYSPLMAGVLSYSILFIPLILGLYGIVRLSFRVSLKHYILLGSLFTSTCFIFLALLSLLMKQDALLYLQQTNETNFIFLQLILGLVYMIFIGMLIVGMSSTENRRSLLMFVSVFLSYFVLGLYYRENVWRPAMKRVPVSTSTTSHIVCSLLCGFLLVVFAKFVVSETRTELSRGPLIDIENGTFSRETAKEYKTQ